MNFRGISRWLLGLAQLLAVQHCADGFSLSNLFSALTGQPLTISTTNAAQNFEGWGTSLAWCGEYLGSLESESVLHHDNVLHGYCRKLVVARSACTFTPLPNFCLRYYIGRLDVASSDVVVLALLACTIWQR